MGATLEQTLNPDNVVCTIHTMKSADLIRELKANGFSLVTVRGSHHKFRDAGGAIVIVPHPKKDLGAGLVASIRKQAGIKPPKD